eukprot:2425767-Prymnesium_polylepis.3
MGPDGAICGLKCARSIPANGRIEQLLDAVVQLEAGTEHAQPQPNVNAPACIAAGDVPHARARTAQGG